jgi:ParB family chromosome partitioning protein
MKARKLSLDQLQTKGAEATEKAAMSSFHERISTAANILAIQPSAFSAAELNRSQDGAYFKTVTIDQVEMTSLNARTIYKPEKIAELALSIKAEGQLVPGLSTIRNGKFLLIAGNYRYKAIRKAGIDTMDLMVRENVTDREIYEISYRENAEREEQTAVDNALAWQRLINDKVYDSQDEIAEAINVTPGYIAKTMSILKLSDPVLNLIKEDPSAYAVTALYELFMLEKVASEELVMEMARKIGAGEAGRRECEELRKKLETPKEPRKTKETSRQYKIMMEENVNGTLKEWDSGRVTLDLFYVDQKDRVKLVDDLKILFHLGD